MATNLSFYVIGAAALPHHADMGGCYKTADGRYVTDSRTLKRIGLLPDGGTGCPHGVERISRNEALTLIARGGYQTDTSNQSQNKETSL